MNNGYAESVAATFSCQLGVILAFRDLVFPIMNSTIFCISGHEFLNFPYLIDFLILTTKSFNARNQKTFRYSLKSKKAEFCFIEV